MINTPDTSDTAGSDPRGTIVTLSDGSGASPAAAPSSATSANGNEAALALSAPSPVAVALSSLAPAICHAPLQPLADIPAYLERRRPVPHYAQEDALQSSLPKAIKEELRKLLGTQPGGGAFGHITHLVTKCRYSVQRAAAEARALYKVPGSLKRLRARYDLWRAKKDWVVLVNRAKAGRAWQDRNDGLPREFLIFIAFVMSQFKREDGQRQAMLNVFRQWQTGRDDEGRPVLIPGYGDAPVKLGSLTLSGGRWQDWYESVGYRILEQPRRPLPPVAPLPPGWSESNIRRQIEKAGLFPDVVRALVQQGTAAAREHLPQTHFDRNRAGAHGGPLRFLEQIEFDDVKVDFLVIDPETGEACDLWLLIARDRATGLLLAYGMRPARTRDDGTQEHLRLRDMKQLCGWILERYGLPPYRCTWRLENGTATLPAALKAALAELLGRVALVEGILSADKPQLDISYTGMIGGKSPAGYKQRAVGNSQGKGSLESHNRLTHTMLSNQPGQTGPLYTRRPADLAARAKEAEQIWQTTQHLPEHLRKRVGYPILTINQAREHLLRIFRLQNERTQHELQGFEDVVEIYDPARNAWIPQNDPSAPATSPKKPHVRKESPLERCARLVAPYRDQWQQVSPDIITAFYEHTCRKVKVETDGHIYCRIEKRDYEFAPAPGAPPQVPGTWLLAYFHPDDPAFLHLTNGKGALLGTWIRAGLAHDQETLTQSIRYNQAALKAAQQLAETYESPERQRLEALRAANAELVHAATFTAVADAPRSHAPRSTISSPVAAGLTAVPRARKQAADTRAADEALAASIDAA